MSTDLETLRRVIPGLEALEQEWHAAQLSVAARARGYFTPDEDDRVRQMLLAYRNYRFALYEIIFRASGYRRVAESTSQLKSFLLGFAAGLTLYSKSLKLIQAYEREPLVRKKLNEPDVRCELEPDFFEDLLRGYSSPGNYAGLVRGAWFWRSHRREIQKLAATSPEDWKWVVSMIRRELAVVRKRFFQVLGCRLRYDWRAFFRTVLRPVRATRYNLRAQIAGACAGLRTTRHYVPSLDASLLKGLRDRLQPGDVLLVRAEQKLTSAILPGFWAHAALFVGSVADLESWQIAGEGSVARHLKRLSERDEGLGCVIEAISPRVQVSSLQFCLCADHVAVLRPRLPQAEIREILIEAFGYLDVPYDFEFDFNLRTRVVCTGLIYRCFHKRGTVCFELTKRLGRYTLSGDDLMNQWIAGLDQPASDCPMPFELVALALKAASGEAAFVEPTDAASALRQIGEGWRPARGPITALAQPHN